MLKVLLKIDDQIQIRPVKVLEETESSYSIDSKDLGVLYVRKEDLYKKRNGFIFGFDTSEIVDAWNSDIKNQVEVQEMVLNRLKNSVIVGEMKDNKYTIKDYRRV